MADAYIYDAVRTVRGKGKSDGALHEITALSLATQVLEALRDRNGLDTSKVDDVVLGCVSPTMEQGSDIARTAVLNADYAQTTAGVQVQIDAYKRRRDMAVAMLNASPGISCHKPEGAFYVFPNVAGCLGKTTAGGRRLATDEDVGLALLEEHYGATVQDAAYHMSPYLRISTATADDELEEGLRRIQTFCEGLH